MSKNMSTQCVFSLEGLVTDFALVGRVIFVLHKMLVQVMLAFESVTAVFAMKLSIDVNIVYVNFEEKFVFANFRTMLALE